MVCRLVTGFSLCLCAAMCTLTLASVDAAETNVSAAQDQPRALPEENAAYFTASDRRIRFQLTAMGSSPASLLAGTPVTVIDPRGRATRLTADDDGVAVLTDAQPGLHAVVTAGRAGHIAVPIVLRQLADDGAEAPADSAIDLPLADVSRGEVLRAVNSFLPPPTALGSMADIDRRLVRQGEIVEGHDYRVRSAADGRVVGRVYSLLRPGTSNAAVGGTNLIVYRNNEVVARATTDEDGRFELENLQPGVHGLIAAGRCGYAAFAFEVVEPQEVVRSASQKTLVSAAGDDAKLPAQLARATQPRGPANVLSALMIPSPIVPAMLQAMRADTTGEPGPLEVGLTPLAPGFAPPLGGIGGGAMGGPGGGFGGGAGGVGAGFGPGGLLALAGFGAAIAAATRSDSEEPLLLVPDDASPKRP